jgi:putative component of membrane protein insertase Oxa1/YidC/SpoIIIJ protein YidD
MKLIILIIFISVISLSAQNDWVKWESKQVSYELPIRQNHDYAVDKSGIGLTVLSVALNAYSFFISDLDGDNCAFSPSCSSFYLQAIKETSIFKGTLMFADRFTRDMNFFKGSNQYALLPSNKFYDPASNYTLHSEKIKF